MPRPSNRQIEQYYFGRFRAHFPLPAGEIEHGDKPDVVIRGERMIGIEIANLYIAHGDDPSSEQVQQRRRENVVREAQQQYFREGGRKIELTITFNAAHPIVDVQSVASALARFATSDSPERAGLLSRGPFAHIPELRDVYFNPNEYDDARWRVAQLYSLPALRVDCVAEIVARKQRLLREYATCDAYWLLLVVDFIDAAQDQEIAWPDDSPSLLTPFERVIVYKPQAAQWIDVPVVRSH